MDCLQGDGPRGGGGKYYNMWRMRSCWRCLLLFCLFMNTYGEVTPCDQSFMARLGSGVLTSPNFPLNYPVVGRLCSYKIYSQTSHTYPLATNLKDNDTPKSTGSPSTNNTQTESNVPETLSAEEHRAAPAEGPQLMAPHPKPEVHDLVGKVEVVCFKFHRFRLADSPNNCSSGDAHLEFPGGVRYCNNGRISTHLPKDAPVSVFEDTVCWPILSDHLEIRFYYPGRSARSDTGFYATFNVSITRQDVRTRQGPAWYPWKTKALCPDTYFVCFDDQSCVDPMRLCNGVNDCMDGSDEEYSHARCAGKETYVGCDFELTSGVVTEFCQFTGYNWNRAVQSMYGPRYDHTIGTMLGPGNFIYSSFTFLEHIILRNTLKVQVPERPTPRCFRFWYFMSGYGLGELSVFMNTTAFSVAPNASTWSREAHQASKWLLAEIDIPETVQEITELMFEVSKGNTIDANIAIDDISMTDGLCYGNDISATFELGPGGWLNYNGYSIWIRRRGPPPWTYGPNTDCSGDSEGFYMHSGFSERTTVSVVRMVSRTVSVTSADRYWCLSFCYHNNGPHSDIGNTELTVILKHVDGSESTEYKENIKTGMYWTQKRMLLMNVYRPVQIIFEARRSSIAGASSVNEISIDNIVLIPSQCHINPTVGPSTTWGPTSPVTCSSREFRCENGECISQDRVCDGRFDCDDLSDERGCGYTGLSVGAVAGLICGVLLAFIITLISFLWAKKRAAARAQNNNNNRPDTYPEEDFVETTTYGEPPPLYTEVDGGDITDGVSQYPVASSRHMMTYSMQWEPPPAYDSPMLSTGPAVPCYSPRLEPPPFEETEYHSHTMMSRRSESVDSKIGGDSLELAPEPGQCSTCQIHPYENIPLPITRTPDEVTPAIPGAPVADPVPSAPQLSIIGTPATGAHLQRYYNPHPIVYQVPNRHRRSFGRSFLRRSRRRSRPDSSRHNIRSNISNTGGEHSLHPARRPSPQSGGELNNFPDAYPNTHDGSSEV